MEAVGQIPHMREVVPDGVTINYPKIWDGRRNGEEGEEEYISIVTVNITFLSKHVRKWLEDLPYDIVMIQEHHKHTKQGFGTIRGYSAIFAPAQVTGSRKRKGQGKSIPYQGRGREPVSA